MFTKILFAIFLFTSIANAADKLKVVATLPELAWAAEKIGGDSVEVISLLSGTEDPHFVDASPAFVFKAAKADVLLLNGLELEAGWLPKVLQMSGRAVIQRGEKGYCDASEKVAKLEVAQNYDRSKGDIHPGGNPHYTLSIVSMIQAGEKIKQCLEKAKGLDLSANFKAFKSSLEALHKEQSAALAGLKGKEFLVYHREFTYFFRDYGLVNAGSLEEVPGVLPSAAYLSRTAQAAKKSKAALVLASSVSPRKYLEKFQELSGIPFLTLQIHSMSGQDYLEFQRKLGKEISAHAK